MPDVLPSGFDDFADHLVPELQRRGLFRRTTTAPPCVTTSVSACPPCPEGVWERST